MFHDFEKLEKDIELAKKFCEIGQKKTGGNRRIALFSVIPDHHKEHIYWTYRRLCEVGFSPSAAHTKIHKNRHLFTDIENWLKPENPLNAFKPQEKRPKPKKGSAKKERKRRTREDIEMENEYYIYSPVIDKKIKLDKETAQNFMSKFI